VSRPSPQAGPGRSGSSPTPTSSWKTSRTAPPARRRAATRVGRARDRRQLVHDHLRLGPSHGLGGRLAGRARRRPPATRRAPEPAAAWTRCGSCRSPRARVRRVAERAGVGVTYRRRERPVAWIGTVRRSLLRFMDAGAARPPIARGRAPGSRPTRKRARPSPTHSLLYECGRWRGREHGVGRRLRRAGSPATRFRSAEKLRRKQLRGPRRRRVSRPAPRPRPRCRATHGVSRRARRAGSGGRLGRGRRPSAAGRPRAASPAP
jgi:hypothetical protein